ncbi:MAG: FliA/WhiG family RNA polymerase sigma factor [Planctomycetia bacterium]|nr:FliA/WhiG family RNA polymerase sigma factor [Planctomycetia bacterium]
MTQVENSDTREDLHGMRSLVGRTRLSDDPDLEKQWISFKETRSTDIKNDLLERYLPIVRYAADRLHRKLPQQVDVDDLYGAGVFGLMDAIENYDLERGVKFETYCNTRVKGSIIDSLRAQDWVPRLVRSTASRLDKAYKELELSSGREPTDLEMANYLGVTESEFDQLQREASAASIVSLTDHVSEETDSRSLRKIDMLNDAKTPAPEANLQMETIMEALNEKLDEREREIFTRYYWSGETMKEIGLRMGLSEYRVCQLHSRTVLKLRQLFGHREMDFSTD